MKIIDCIQGSPEWHKAKCGIPSASNFDKIVDIKGNPSKQREKYLYQLAGERITKKSGEEYQNSAMERGQDLEDEARKYYELITGRKVKQIGFCLNEGKFIYGTSPDGLVGKEGLLEIKCPLMSTHISYFCIGYGTLPLDYFQQVQGQILVTGRKWVDFMSYYPGIRPLIIRVKPNKEFLSKLKRELELFCIDLNKLVRRIK